MGPLKRFAVLEYNSKRRASRVVCFIMAENVPDANLRYARTWSNGHVDRNIFSRPAWDGAPAHYTTVRLYK
jgi:hypothetical protein